MMHGVLPRALLAAALLLAPFLAPAQVDVPRLTARVTDLTGTLSPEHRAALEQKLVAIEARKGSQVAVLIVPTVQPEAIEQYAIRVFDQWKLGRKNVDDGVLLVIAKNDRKLRIEVGRGLEGAIPDAIAKRIIDEDITSRFKQGDFYGGISAGTDRIVRLIDGESMPPPAQRPASNGSGGSGLSSDLIIYGLFAAIALASVLQSVLGRLGASAVTGGIAGFIVFVLAGLGLGLLAAIGIFLVTLFMSFSGGSGWSSGGSGYSSGGSWSSGGGGFSGGGGGSSGGGASGSW